VVVGVWVGVVVVGVVGIVDVGLALGVGLEVVPGVGEVVKLAPGVVTEGLGETLGVGEDAGVEVLGDGDIVAGVVTLGLGVGFLILGVALPHPPISKLKLINRMAII
jgi:hypothetical protein